MLSDDKDQFQSRLMAGEKQSLAMSQFAEWPIVALLSNQNGKSKGTMPYEYSDSNGIGSRSVCWLCSLIRAKERKKVDVSASHSHGKLEPGGSCVMKFSTEPECTSFRADTLGEIRIAPLKNTEPYRKELDKSHLISRQISFYILLICIHNTSQYDVLQNSIQSPINFECYSTADSQWFRNWFHHGFVRFRRSTRPTSKSPLFGARRFHAGFEAKWLQPACASAGWTM